MLPPTGDDLGLVLRALFLAAKVHPTLGQPRLLQEQPKLLSRLGKAGAVGTVDDEDDPIHLREVVPPDAPGCLMPAQVKGPEPDFSDEQLLRVRIESREMDGNAIVLQNTQQRGLPGMVKAEEEDLGLFEELTLIVIRGILNAETDLIQRIDDNLVQEIPSIGK